MNFNDVASATANHFTPLTEPAFPGRSIHNEADVNASVLANGCLQTLEVGPTLINLYVGQPIGGGVHRLVLRRHLDDGGVTWKDMVGPDATSDVAVVGNSIRWSGRWDDVDAGYRVTLSLHEEISAWAWSVQIEGGDRCNGRFDVALVQDVGIASRGQVQNNEAYTSQYIDHQIAKHPTLGPVIMARQNLGQHEGSHPWVMHACVPGAAGAMTDGLDFFGSGYKKSGQPLALAQAEWPSNRRQFEMSCHALLSSPVHVDSGSKERITFVARYLEDHPGPSGVEDLTHLDALTANISNTWPIPDGPGEPFGERSWLLSTPLVSGEQPSKSQIESWFGSDTRHVETLGSTVASIFHGEGRHAAFQNKELSVHRRHANLIKVGGGRLPGEEVLCSTGYACGIFASHICLGNTNFHKLFSVCRDPLNVVRDSGLRLLMKRDNQWVQLGVASAFDMGVQDARWVYVLGQDQIDVVCSAGNGDDSLQFSVEVVEGPPAEFMIIANVVVGDRENDQAPRVVVDAENGRFTFTPDTNSMLAQRYPESQFTMTFADPTQVAAMGGDELLYEDGKQHAYPMIAAQSNAVSHLKWSVTGRLLAAPAKPQATATGIDVQLSHHESASVSSLAEAMRWFDHNASIHLTAPHGIEQYSGAAWGVRDVCQGPLEWLLARGEYKSVADILADVFAHQYEQTGDWPQWYMHEPYRSIESPHSHGDIAVWPIIAVTNYLQATGDLSLLDQVVPYTDLETLKSSEKTATIREHLDHAVRILVDKFISGTSLLSYGDGDWNDSLQPAESSLRESLVSGWTVQLFYQALGGYAEALTQAGDADAANSLQELANEIRSDFNELMVIDDTVAGFYLHDDDSEKARALLHPTDTETGIHYRLLPMIRGVISGMFTVEQAAHHVALIEEHLLAPDGARLMDRPPTYRGGLTRFFQRAESASFFGREVGLMYTHAHLRYAQAMARLGRSEALLDALLTVNPVGIQLSVPNALPRQANAYFSSSDADFADRSASEAGYDDLMQGDVPVHGGWRVYSSGPGIYVGLVAQHMLGIRRHYDHLIIDPVLPGRLDGLTAELHVAGRRCRFTFNVTSDDSIAQSVSLNGQPIEPVGREANPYREGGLMLKYEDVVKAMNEEDNAFVIGL